MGKSREVQYKRLLQNIEDRKKIAVARDNINLVKVQHELDEQACRATLYPEMLALLKDIEQLHLRCDITANTPNGTIGLVRITNLIAKCEGANGQT